MKMIIFFCDVEIVEDTNITGKDLEQLASGLTKKFEKLQVLNKKDLNEGLNSRKKFKKSYTNI